MIYKQKKPTFRWFWWEKNHIRQGRWYGHYITDMEVTSQALSCDFTQPGRVIFMQLTTGRILCAIKRTVTGILPFADPDGMHAHDAYHRFFPDACWCMALLDGLAVVSVAKKQQTHVYGYAVESNQGHAQHYPRVERLAS